ncbi:GcrA family cell cycle regulator [Bradyrhizobium sp. SZCCHNR1075]|uniref:GcrA family cell cycle regulator n=1 Tax=Bradyrhizobium sp. SZCCHNR1075 TaxID=3057362 RepID=UPI0028E87E2F|nr:GcrA family cell cycle regulator [Bradyrhizobium sp. SZCCHNR1075]
MARSAKRLAPNSSKNSPTNTQTQKRSKMSDFPNKARFVDTTREQCQFFLPGESGMHGFVCGDATREASAFCECHHRVVFQPQRVKLRSVQDRNVRYSDLDEVEPDLTELVL